MPLGITGGAINMSMIIQIVLALVIIIILYIVTLVVLNIDAIVVRNTTKVKPHETTMIISGYAPVSYLGNKSYNTFNSFADNFRKIGKSVNTSGGSQFSYQFWIKIDDANDKLFKDLVLLLKGDKRKYKIGLYDAETLQRSTTLPSTHAIACPLIKFVDSYRNISVHFGTTNSPITSVNINMNPNDPGEGRRNLLSLLPLNWYLFTFVFEDNFSYQSGSENGINFKFWVNDIPYQENTASDNPELRNNTLKQNDGDLFILPNPPESGEFMKLGNIKYCNYALDGDDIKRTYQGGPPTTLAIKRDQGESKPTYLTGFNKIDIYNR
jgi:hypothetical protein